MRQILPPKAEYARKGWEDVMAGCGFAPDYDRYSSTQQHRYEEGRLKAARWLVQHKGIDSKLEKPVD